MLIRSTNDDLYECIAQEHHALVSGWLAGAWAQSHIDPLLVTAITLHDAPWRSVDADPTLDDQTGLPHDFITYPMDEKVAFYRSGIDQLESIHPYVAYMVSRHYTTFSGTRDVERLQEPERQRRKRLETLLADPLVSGSDRALEWVKFFDVFSLHLCLTGPRARRDSIPRWLSDPSAWSTAPDGTELAVAWVDDATLRIDPWPFDKARLYIDVYHRRLETTFDDGDQLADGWRDAPHESRPLTLRPPIP